MCLAVLAKIEKIYKNKALANFGGVRREIDISLLEKVKEGDLVLVHVGYAIQRIEEKKIEDNIYLMKKFTV